MPWNGSWIFILIAFVRLLPAMHYHVIPQRTWIKVCAIALAALHCNYTDHNCTWFSVGSLWIHLMFAPFHIHHNNIWFQYASNPFALSAIVDLYSHWSQSYLIPKCFDSLWTLSACFSLNLKWHESHLSNSFIIWLFVDSDTSIRCWFVVTIIATKY